MRRKRRISRERGAAAVEFAILLPVLVAILCGTIDWGYYFFTREIVVNASREGARVGTLQLPGLIPAVEAKNAALEYLKTASLQGVVDIDTGKDASPDCPEDASCIRIAYETGGSVTGFTASLVPDEIVAYAQMRR